MLGKPKDNLLWSELRSSFQQRQCCESEGIRKKVPKASPKASSRKALYSDQQRTRKIWHMDRWESSSHYLHNWPVCKTDQA